MCVTHVTVTVTLGAPIRLKDLNFYRYPGKALRRVSVVARGMTAFLNKKAGGFNPLTVPTLREVLKRTEFP